MSERMNALVLGCLTVIAFKGSAVAQSAIRRLSNRIQVNLPPNSDATSINLEVVSDKIIHVVARPSNTDTQESLMTSYKATTLLEYPIMVRLLMK